MMQSLAGVCLLIIINIMAVLVWVQLLIGINTVSYLAAMPKTTLGVIGLSPAAIFLAYWLPKERYKKIIEEFDAFTKSATKEQKILFSVCSWAYQIVTWGVFVGGLILLRNRLPPLQ